jgi:hypothetical protein
MIPQKTTILKGDRLTSAQALTEEGLGSADGAAPRMRFIKISIDQPQDRRDTGPTLETGQIRLSKTRGRASQLVPSGGVLFSDSRQLLLH